MRIVDGLLEVSARRPLAAAAATIGYVLLVTVTHDHVQDVAYWLQKRVGKELWVPAVAAMGVAALALASVAAWRAMAGSPVRRDAQVVWWGTVSLLGAVFLTLLATNMEAVHFLQYAIPAVPVYALTRRFGATVLVVTALGAFDETWQYAVLHRGWGIPWDANDIVLNLSGACLGCSAIVAFARVERVDVPPRRVFAAPIAAAVVVFGGALALQAAGLLALYPEDGPAAAIQLSRSPRPEHRWESPEWGRGHFVIHPGLAMGIVVLMAARFAALDRRVRWRPQHERAAGQAS